jgi:cell division protein FtsL
MDESIRRSKAMTFTPRERALFVAIVAVLVVAIGLVVMVKH